MYRINFLRNCIRNLRLGCDETFGVASYYVEDTKFGLNTIVARDESTGKNLFCNETVGFSNTPWGSIKVVSAMLHMMIVKGLGDPMTVEFNTQKQHMLLFWEMC